MDGHEVGLKYWNWKSTFLVLSVLTFIIKYEMGKEKEVFLGGFDE